MKKIRLSRAGAGEGKKEKILGLKGRSPKNSFKFCSDGSKMQERKKAY